MKQTYDIDTTLFALLNGSTTLKQAITGGVYAGQRPLNSVAEDVVVNTIALTQEYFPQLGTSNVNIHVPDLDVKIGGVQQKVENRTRLRVIAGIVLDLVRETKFDNIGLVVESQTTIREEAINQHYVNIRISYIIHA